MRNGIGKRFTPDGPFPLSITENDRRIDWRGRVKVGIGDAKNTLISKRLAIVVRFFSVGIGSIKFHRIAVFSCLFQSVWHFLPDQRNAVVLIHVPNSTVIFNSTSLCHRGFHTYEWRSNPWFPSHFSSL